MQRKQDQCHGLFLNLRTVEKPNHVGVNIGIASPSAALRKTTRTGAPIFNRSKSQSTRFVSMLTPSSSVT